MRAGSKQSASLLLALGLFAILVAGMANVSGLSVAKGRVLPSPIVRLHLSATMVGLSRRGLLDPSFG